MPGRYLLRKDKGDIIVSFITSEMKVKHYCVNQRSDSLLYKARPELRRSIVDTFTFMRETMEMMLLYPVNADDHVVPDGNDGDNDVPGEGVRSSCRVCGLQDPPTSHIESHRLIFCNRCDSMVERRVWGQHRCNQADHQCQLCDYSTGVPANLRRHMRLKHRVPHGNNENGEAPEGGQDTGGQQRDGDDGDNDEAPGECQGDPGASPDAATARTVEDQLFSNISDYDSAPPCQPSQAKQSSRRRFKVSLSQMMKHIMTVMMIVMAFFAGSSGSIHCNPSSYTDMPGWNGWDPGYDGWDEDFHPKPVKRPRGRPRGRNWPTCDTCGVRCSTRARLRTHQRKHDRAMKKLHEKYYCEFAKYGCKHSSKRKHDMKKHEKSCRHKPRSPKSVTFETLWNLISMFPLSNTMAYNFLRGLEKALEFRFLPTNMKESMKTQLNCCMQFLKSEIVQFKVSGHPSEY